MCMILILIHVVFEGVPICGIDAVDCSGGFEGLRWDAESDCDYAKGCWSFGIRSNVQKWFVYARTIDCCWFGSWVSHRLYEPASSHDHGSFGLLANSNLNTYSDVKKC
jgi:predicted small integral membrane protein